MNIKQLPSEEPSPPSPPPAKTDAYDIEISSDDDMPSPSVPELSFRQALTFFMILASSSFIISTSPGFT